MNRAAPLLAVLVVVAGCSADAPVPGPSAATGCTRLLVPAAPADGPSTAILKDVAGGPREFLIGAPGGSVNIISAATGSSAPRLAAGRVFFSTGAAQGQGVGGEEIMAAHPGECSVRVAVGALSEVEAQGRALVVGDGTLWHIVDANGQMIAEVPGPGGFWTGDGHLVEPTASFGISVFDLAGKHTELPLPPGATPSGPLGPHQELISTPAGVVTVDVRDGKVAALPQPLEAQRLLGGSPDGNYVAYLDLLGSPHVLNLKDGHHTPLPNPGPSVGVRWESDSRWIAVQGLYGGAVMRLSDGRVIDLGPLTVVSW